MTTSAIKQRMMWQEAFRNGEAVNSFYLREHKKNRNDPHWRTTRELEHLCEYIIYLEEMFDES